MIEIYNATKSYDRKTILSIDTLSISSPGFLYIYGESGAGKTTLINCIFGLDHFDSGEILVNGKKVDDLKKYASFVFQDFQLIDKWTVHQNLLLAREDCSEDEIDEVLRRLNIDDIKEKLAYDISAGQKQRVAIARALLLKRTIMIMDEPFSNLDKKNKAEVIELLKAISLEKLVIVITHEELDESIYSQKIEIKDQTAISTNNSNKDEAIVSVSRKDLSFRHIFKFALLFMRKCKSSILSIFALVLCFSFLFLELGIVLKNPSDQAYNYYQTSKVDYVNFCSFVNDNDLVYLSYHEKNAKNSFRTVNMLNYEITNEDNQGVINAIWAKEMELGVDTIILSNDLIELLDINYGDIVNLFNHDYQVVQHNIMSSAMRNTLITSVENYEDMIVRCYKMDPSIYTNYGFIDIKTYEEAGIQNYIKGQISISKGLKHQIEFSLEIDDFTDKTLALTVKVNNHNNKYGNETKKENLSIDQVIDETHKVIYCDSETYDRICKNYSSFSLLNGLLGYGYIKPSKSNFSTAYNNGLIDYSSISNSLSITNGFLNSWNVIFIPISIVLFTISLIVMVLCINYSIKLNTKELGILLSLDYSRKNFSKILILEILFISTISIIIATPLGIGVTELFNFLLRRNFQYNGSPLYIIWFIPFVEIGIIALLLIFYIIFIIYRLLRKTNIQIIYGK